jgi:hypothetical protein
MKHIAHYTIHHGITGSIIGKALPSQAAAERQAARLSLSPKVNYTLDIKEGGKSEWVSFACNGTLYPRNVFAYLSEI